MTNGEKINKKIARELVWFHQLYESIIKMTTIDELESARMVLDERWRLILEYVKEIERLDWGRLGVDCEMILKTMPSCKDFCISTIDERIISRN